MTKHLVIGASGLVGGSLQRELGARGADVLGTQFAQRADALLPLDMRDASAVRTLILRSQPDIIYLPAALTNVEYCETHPQESRAVNLDGTRAVAEAARAAGARLVFFSSDYVFDGENGPYSETDAPNPICEYGRQKLLGERLVTALLPDSLIVRTTVVYGWERQGKNFVQRLTERLEAGEQVRVPCDQVGSPTYAPDLADAVIELAAARTSGLYHIAGPLRADRYTFAVAAARFAGLDPDLIIPVLTCELGQVARRPMRAGMWPTLAEKALGRSLVDYRDGLRRMLDTSRAARSS